MSFTEKPSPWDPGPETIMPDWDDRLSTVNAPETYADIAEKGAAAERLQTEQRLAAPKRRANPFARLFRSRF